MPNHITNILTIKADGELVKEVLLSIKGEERLIDFNKIIPMPESLNVTSGSNVDNAIAILTNDNKLFSEMLDWNWVKEENINSIEQLKERLMKNISEKDMEEAKISLYNIEKYGHKNWYSWSIANWGTKWNAYDIYSVNENSISFDTAWSTPFPVIEELSKKFPSITFEVKYADEDIGSNCGSYELRSGVLVWDYSPQGYTATKYALKVKGDEDRIVDYLAWSLPNFKNEEWNLEIEEDVMDIVSNQEVREEFLETLFDNCNTETQFYFVKGKLVNLCIKYELYEHIKTITEFVRVE